MTKNERIKDWREKCCEQCKYHFIKFEGVEAQCDISKCSDEAASNFTTNHGCQGVREYLETGIFPERARKK